MLTLSNTNYNGEALESIYTVVGVGNEVVQKGSAKVFPGIADKLALPRMTQTEDPIGPYFEDVPDSETVTTTYAERQLLMEEASLYEEFNPTDFSRIWDAFQSAGDFTNLELNSNLLNSILARYENGIGTQVSKLFWQGDKSLPASNKLARIDGIVTKMIADSNVIKPTPQGNITAANYFDILAAVWQAIPDKYLDDPDFILHVNTSDYKVMQAANTNVKKDFVGVFGMSLDDMYQQKKIRHFQGMKRHHIVGARVTNDEESNLCMGVYVMAENEEPIVSRVANNGRKWFVRIDMKLDANYRAGEDAVLYEPA